MRPVLVKSVFAAMPLSHVGGVSRQTDQGTALRTMGDPVVRDLLAKFEAQWGMSALQILSVDSRTRIVKNVLAAYPS